MDPEPREAWLDQLVTITQVLAEDASLRNWFLGLEKLSDPQRIVALDNLAARMHNGRESTELIGAIASLKDWRVYSAVKKTMASEKSLRGS